MATCLVAVVNAHMFDTRVDRGLAYFAMAVAMFMVVKKTKNNIAVCCWFVVCLIVDGNVVCSL